MSVVKSALTNTPEREWTTREQLILASAVLKSGDQNWVSVSRAIKPVLEVESGSADHFSHKNCAQQYSAMLDKAGTHKRKRGIDGNSEVETAGQQIVRELVDQHLTELDQALAQSREEYLALKKEMDQIEKGELDAQLPSMWEGIQAELALSKASSGSRKKSSPSKSSLNKQLDQAKQRKKGSPGGAHSTGLMRSLSSGAAGNKKAVMSVMREDVAGSEGHADEDRSKGQMAALLSHGGSPVSSVASDTEHPLAMVVGGDRLHSPLPLVQSPSVAQERGTVSPGVSGAAAVSVGGVVLSAGGAVLPAGGVVLSAASVSQEQVGIAKCVAGLSSIDAISEMKVKLEPGSGSTQKGLVSPSSSKQPPLSSLVKLPLDLRSIKKEPPSSSPTMDTTSPRLIATPIKEEKMWVPMQTPPSTHVSQMPAEVHVIIQQPNTAAVLVQEHPVSSRFASESSGTLPKLPLVSSAPSISSPALYSVSSASLATAAATTSVTVALPAKSNSGTVSSAVVPSLVSISPSTSSTHPATTHVLTGTSVGTGGSSAVNLHVVPNTSPAVPSIHSTGSSTGLVVTGGGLQVQHSGAVPLGTSSISASNSSPVISPVLSTSPSPGTNVVPTALSTSVVNLAIPANLKHLISSSSTTMITTTTPSSSIGSSSAAPVTLRSSSTAASASHTIGMSASRTLSASLSLGAALTQVTSGLGKASVPVILPTTGASPVAGSAVKLKTTYPVAAVASANRVGNSASMNLKSSVSPGVKISPSVSVTSIGTGPGVCIITSGVSPSIIVTCQAGASTSSSSVGAAVKMALSPTLSSSSFRSVSTSPSALTSFSTPTLSGSSASNPSVSVAIHPVLSSGVVSTPTEGVPVKSVTVKHRPIALSKEVIKVNIKEGLSLHAPIRKSPGTLDLTSSPISASLKSPSITSLSSGGSTASPLASPQSSVQVMPSSSSPLPPSAGNPLLSSHLLGALPSAAKSSIISTLKMSPTLVTIGGVSKSSSASTIITVSQPITKQKTSAEPIEKRAPSRVLSSHSDTSVSSKVSPVSVSTAVPAARTFSVANTSAVVAHCMASVTGTKSKLRATGSMPTTKTTSPTSRSSLSAAAGITAIPSSLSIPVLAPSKDLLSAAKQAARATAIVAPIGKAAPTSEVHSTTPISKSPVEKLESKIKLAYSEQTERKHTSSSSEPEMKPAAHPATSPPATVPVVEEVKQPSTKESPVPSSKQAMKSPEKASSPHLSSLMEVANEALGGTEEAKQEDKGKRGSSIDSREETPIAPCAAAEDNQSPSTAIKGTTPMGSVDQDTPRSCDLDSSIQSKPDTGRSQDELDALDDEAPLKASNKSMRSSLKKQWNTRSRKRKTPQHRSQSIEEGHSVESTDTEDDMISHPSAVTSPAPSQGDDSESILAHRQWKKAIILVWRHAAQHKYANLFLHPVKEDDAPGYKNVILRPMDLSTIKKKIDNGSIKTDIEFQRDMLLMFQNAFMYNNAEHEVYYMAMEMKNDVMENIQAYLATQAQLQLMEETTPSKILRSREGRFKDSYEEHMSPAKRRRTRADD